MPMLLLFLLLALLGGAAAACPLVCSPGTTCYNTATAALGCMEDLPFNQGWANATLDVLTQSLENFGFAALYHSTGPPYPISLDIQADLAATRAEVAAKGFASDLIFQEHLQSLFQKTIDAHTRYQKPACYNAYFIQPFAFDIRVNETTTSPDNEPKLYLMKNLYTDEYAKWFPNVPLSDILDKEVSLLNGVEFITEISSWGDTHETRSNNRGARFNAAIRSYLYRSAIAYNVLPLTDLGVTLVDGSSYSIPWMASYTYNFANVSLCAAAPKEEAPAQRSLLNEQKGRKQPMKDLVHEDHWPTQTLDSKHLTATRPDRQIIVPSNDTAKISCFVQTMPDSKDAELAGVKRVLVMKVSSFSPEGEYLDAWAHFLGNAQKCLSVQFDLLVVDVMQNGGGYVCLGLRLIELLVEEYEDDHKKVQMRYDLPHSPLMDAYIEAVNDPNPYPYPQDVEHILNPATQEPYVDGRAYYYPGHNVTQGGVVNWRTNYFTLDCRDAEAMPANGWRPPVFMPPEKLIILTDGTCGSTCASFTKIPQEAGKATFVGAGGIWDEGMDVSSFAGGFVCNPDYLTNLAAMSNLSFPKFATNQRWQFAWATWYSTKQPSRPTQFTVQDPNYRQPFWGFPHASIDPTVTTAMVSALYDKVIDSTIARLASAVTPASADDTSSTSSDSCSSTETTNKWLTAVSVILGLYAAGSLFYLYKYTDVFSSKEHKYFNPNDSRKKPLLGDLSEA